MSDLKDEIMDCIGLDLFRWRKPEDLELCASNIMQILEDFQQKEEKTSNLSLWEIAKILRDAGYVTLSNKLLL